MRLVALGLSSLVGFPAFALAQKPGLKPPTEADWAAVAKLPDVTGVWELTFGAPGGRGAGGGRGRAGGPPAGPQLTPAYAEKRRANLAKGSEDAQTANCLPLGMPGIMGQPYPMEFLLTPG